MKKNFLKKFYWKFFKKIFEKFFFEIFFFENFFWKFSSYFSLDYFFNFNFFFVKSGLDTFRILRHNGASMHQVSLHLPVSHSKLRPVWWELALVQPVHSCHAINRMSIMHPCGAPQMECVGHDWWCRNVMTSNTDQMVGVNVQCTWNGVSDKIDDMVSISQADRMVGSTQSALGMG